MVSGILIKTLPKLHFNSLPPATGQAFLALSKSANWLKSGGWYLAGGTALALQAGHRASVDLDFFTRKKTFDIEGLERSLSRAGKWKTTLTKPDTLYGIFLKAKVSFIAYPFFIPSRKKLQYGNIALLKPDDIAVMKIIAISQRGKKRDFVDLYWYCNNVRDLETAFFHMLKQYPQDHNTSHILKSLAYFDDAEKDPMPNLEFSADWQKVKAYFRREVPRITRKFLGLD